MSDCVMRANAVRLCGPVIEGYIRSWHHPPRAPGALGDCGFAPSRRRRRSWRSEHSPPGATSSGGSAGTLECCVSSYLSDVPALALVGALGVGRLCPEETADTLSISQKDEDVLQRDEAEEARRASGLCGVRVYRGGFVSE